MNAAAWSALAVSVSWTFPWTHHTPPRERRQRSRVTIRNGSGGELDERGPVGLGRDSAPGEAAVLPEDAPRAAKGVGREVGANKVPA